MSHRSGLPGLGSGDTSPPRSGLGGKLGASGQNGRPRVCSGDQHPDPQHPEPTACGDGLAAPSAEAIVSCPLRRERTRLRNISKITSAGISDISNPWKEKKNTIGVCPVCVLKRLDEQGVTARDFLSNFLG